MRYKVTVVELVPAQTGVLVASTGEVEGQPVFVTTIDHKPDLGKLVEALRPPRVRVRKPKS